MTATIQSVQEVCHKRYSFHADPRFGITKNLELLALNTHPNDMPQRPRNSKVHNLCEDKSSVSQELLDTRGLDLGYSVVLPQPESNPIDFERLRRSIRIQCSNLPEPEEEYNPNIYKRSEWKLDLAAKVIEDAVNAFERNTNEDYQESKRTSLVYNINENSIEMLRIVKRKRQLIVTATDKGLGTAVMECKQYTRRALEDHLNNTSNYKEIQEAEAKLINETNYRWICERFIDRPKPNTVSANENLLFPHSLCGLRAKYGITNMQASLQLPYFYILPNVHKTPWATRPVVSRVSTVLEPLSKSVDIQLQRIVHLYPVYLKDSWYFLNDIKDLKNLKGHSIVTSDAKSMYSKINTR